MVFIGEFFGACVGQAPVARILSCLRCDHCGKFVYQMMGKVMRRQGFGCSNQSCEMFVHQDCIVPCVASSSCPFVRPSSTGTKTSSSRETTALAESKETKRRSQKGKNNDYENED